VCVCGDCFVVCVGAGVGEWVAVSLLRWLVGQWWWC
jgi:hypothetical protein